MGNWIILRWLIVLDIVYLMSGDLNDIIEVIMY